MNILNVYDPYFYASESLIWLQKALGLANRVHRGFDKAPQQLGSVIQIRRPAQFQATQVDTTTGGTTQDLQTEYVSIELDRWHEVKFRVSDAELSYTGERIISEHIEPAAYAIADKIDQDVAALYRYVPWNTDVSAVPAVSDITSARNLLFDNLAPLNMVERNHIMIDGTTEAGFLNLEAFSQSQGAGNLGVDTQVSGNLATRYGFQIFANQNTPMHTTGAMADTAGDLTNPQAKGDTIITIGNLTIADSVEIGDTFVIAGNTQQYNVQRAEVLAGTSLTAIEIYPPLVQDYNAADVVTFDVPAEITEQSMNLAFVRDFAALAMAPLPDIANAMGAQIATVSDPVTGVSVRSRMFYDGDNSSVVVSIDALWGVQILNNKLAVRMRRTLP